MKKHIILLLIILSVSVIAFSACDIGASEKLTATYDDSHTVYAGDSLDSLKPYLTVKYTNKEGKETTVQDYTLSGTLNKGNSTITVKYKDITCTVIINVQEQTIIEPTEGLEYTLNDDNASYSVTGMGTATDTDIVIAAEYNSKPVTKIGGSAFGNNKDITSITIPASITSMGEGSSENIAKVIANRETGLNGAFAGCENLNKVYYQGTIEGWCNIGFYYYSVGTSSPGSNPLCNGADLYINNELVTEVVVPNTVTKISEYAFYFSKSITRVSIGNGVTTIGFGAFGYCSNLSSIEISASVKSIGYMAFYGCENLSKVSYTGTLADWCDINFSDAANPLEYAHNLYINNELVTDILIPDSLSEIKDYVFSGCSITHITIPVGITSIGYGAFYCSNLASVTISDSVKSIGGDAFYNCRNLTSVTIGKGVTSIDFYAFRNCSNLTTIKFEGTIDEWNKITKGNDWKVNVPATQVICSDGEVAI